MTADEELRARLAEDPEVTTLVVAATKAVAVRALTAIEVVPAKWVYVQKAENLHGVLDRDRYVIVIVEGAEIHRNWPRIQRQLLIAKSAEIAVYRIGAPETEPGEVEVTAVLIRKGHIGVARPRGGVGTEMFQLQTPEGNVNNLDRGEAESLVSLLKAWLAGEPVLDPEAAKAAAIRAAVERSGDPYAKVDP